MAQTHHGRIVGVACGDITMKCVWSAELKGVSSSRTESMVVENVHRWKRLQFLLLSEFEGRLIADDWQQCLSHNKKDLLQGPEN